MASLSTISNDIKLVIIEYIDRTPPSQASNPNEQDASNSASKLPRANINLLNLSCANRLFRSLVAPSLFRTLILHNTSKAGASVNLIANSQYTNFVKRLEFIGTTTVAPDWTYTTNGLDKNKYAPNDEDLPAPVRNILSKSNVFPNLEELGVGFAFEDDSHEWIFDHLEAENEEQVLAAEESEGWRSLTNNIYSALIRNPRGAVKTLALRNVVPRQCSIWRSDAWHTFLGGLTSFSLSYHEGISDDGWRPSIEAGYMNFVNNTDEYFWNHLRNTTHLSVAASPSGILGVDYVSVTPLPVHASQLPKLESITLDYVFMESTLLSMLISHAATLRSVKLDHVFVSRVAPEVADGEQMSWGRAFTTLSRAGVPFPNLVEFEVISRKGDKEMWAGVSKSASSMEEKGRLAAEEKQDERSVELHYALVDYKDGHIVTDFDSDQVAETGAQVGMDRLAYEEFMRIVEGNRRRLGVM